MKKWLKRLLIVFIVLAALLVVAYVVVSRPAFINAVVLPRVEEATAMEIKISGIKFSPFKSLDLHGIQFQHSEKPLEGRIEHLECRYSAMSFLFGSPRIDQLRLTRMSGSYTAPQAAGDDHTADPAVYSWEQVSVELTGIRAKHTAKLDMTGHLKAVNAEPGATQGGTVRGTGRIDFGKKLFPTNGSIEAGLDNLAGTAGGIPLENHQGELSAEFAATPQKWKLPHALLKLTENQGETLVAQATATAEGDIQPFTAKLHLDVAPVTSQALNIAGSFYHGLRFGEGSMEYHADATYGVDGSIALTGALSMQNAEISSLELDISGMPLLAANLNHDLAYSPNAKSARIEALDAVLTMDNEEVVLVRLADPATVRLAKTEQEEVSMEPATLDFRVKKLPLKLANIALTGADSPRIDAGAASADLKVKIAALGQSAAITGPVEITGLGMRIPKKEMELEEVGVTYNINATMQEMRDLTLSPNTITVTAAGQDAAAFRPELSCNVETKSGTFALEIEKLTPAIAALLPPDLLADSVIMRLEAGGSVTGSFDATAKTANVEYEINLPAAQITTPDKGPTPSLAASFKGSSRYTDGLLEISPTVLESSADNQQLAHLAVDGAVAVPIDTGKTEINLKSDGMNLLVLKDIAAKLKREKEEEIEPEPPPEKPTPKPGKPKRQIDAVAHLDMQNLVYDEVTVGSIRGDVYYRGTTLETEDLEIEVNEAPLVLSAMLDHGKKRPQYDVKASLGKLMLDPFLRSFDLKEAGDIVDAGINSLALEARGRGFELADLRRNLTGKMDLKLDLLSIRGWDELAEFARQYQWNELESLLFNQGRISAHAEDGKILLDDVYAVGENLKVIIDGTIGLDSTLDGAAHFAAGGKLLERMKKQGYDGILSKPENGYRALPRDIPIGGTWDDIEIDFSMERMLKDALKDKGRDAARETLRQLEEEGDVDWDNVLDNVLKGRSKEEQKPTPETEEEPDAEPQDLQKDQADDTEEKDTEDILKDAGKNLLRDFLKKQE